MSSLTRAKILNYIEWCQGRIEAENNNIERAKRIKGEIEDALEMWKSTLEKMEKENADHR